MKLLILNILLLLSFFNFQESYGQESESIIHYNLLSNTVNKPIPFDKAFSLIIDSLSSKGLRNINVFELDKNATSLNHGPEYEYINSSHELDKGLIADIVKLNHNINRKELEIYFPPLKPSKFFNINLEYDLSKPQIDKLLQVNEQLSKKNIRSIADLKEGTTQTYNSTYFTLNKAYSSFLSSVEDKQFNSTNTSLEFVDYCEFYLDNLVTNYNLLKNTSNYSVNSQSTLNLRFIRFIDILNKKTFNPDSISTAYLTELVLENKTDHFLLGKTSYPDALKDKSSLSDIQKISENLTNNLKLLEQYLLSVNKAIASNIYRINYPGQTVLAEDLRNDIKLIKTDLEKNKTFVNKILVAIKNEIQNNTEIKQGRDLLINNYIEDLKTQSGYRLFLNLGLAETVNQNYQNRITTFPRIYSGVTFFFRPVDKNTRLTRFEKKPNKESLGFQNSCQFVAPENLRSFRSIWQRLGVNIGLTHFNIRNTYYENLFPKNSLIIGPTYRAINILSISTGVSLTRTTSKNPLISEKIVVPGFYISASSNIDFIGVVGKLFNIPGF